MGTSLDVRFIFRQAMRACLPVLLAAGVGCSRAPEPVGDAPVVYDFAERAEHAIQVGTWGELDLGSSDTDIFLAKGWATPGQTSDGTPARWMSKKVAGVTFFLSEPADLTMTASCKPYTRSYMAQTLTIVVNGNVAAKQELERSSSLSDYTFKIPSSFLLRGNNEIEFKARYASRRHGTAIRFGRLEMSAASGPTPELPPVGRIGDPLLQEPGTRVAWHIVAPQAGYVRVQPEFQAVSPGGECNVVFCLDGDRYEIGTFTESRKEPQVLSLARWPGARGRIEFEVLGTNAVHWKGAVIGGRVSPKDVNILFFTIDTLREDHVGAYGYQRDTTPCFDRLATRGTMFLNAFVSSNLSSPSHACMLTSRYPQSHGLFANGRTMDRQQLTVSQLLRRAGYETAIYSNFPLLHRGDMTGKGFTTRRYVPGTADTPDVSGKEMNVYAAAMKWLKSNRKKKMFLMVHSEYLHLQNIPEPYDAMYWEKPADITGKSYFPALSEKQRSTMRREYNQKHIDLSEDEIQSVTDYYDGAIRLTDDCIAAFMDVVGFYGLDPFTAVAITSDHGISIGQNHRISHTGWPFDHLLKVPMLFVLPGVDQEAGRSVEGIVESVDIAPTLLSYTGISVPRRMQGIDLLPWIVANGRPSDEVKECSYAALKGYSRWYSIRTKEWRYSVNAEEKEILEKNPRSDEQPVSVVRDFPKEREELRKKLFHWVNATPDVTEETDKHLPPEITEMLRKAGYLDDIQ
ncbi:MAG: sulfatase [Kiritimatiellia bacterium]|nr:sulfatase [Kiritimatiellia bacterium]MDP6847935.1 sulfatase [Kiritimatiellia bacterium]